MYKVIITETAHKQIDNAYDWYEIKSAGLGHLFFVSIMDCIKSGFTTFCICKGLQRNS
jgi:hypothetical protein